MAATPISNEGVQAALAALGVSNEDGALESIVIAVKADRGVYESRTNPDDESTQTYYHPISG